MLFILRSSSTFAIILFYYFFNIISAVIRICSPLPVSYLSFIHHSSYLINVAIVPVTILLAYCPIPTFSGLTSYCGTNKHRVTWPGLTAKDCVCMHQPIQSPSYSRRVRDLTAQIGIRMGPNEIPKSRIGQREGPQVFLLRWSVTGLPCPSFRGRILLIRGGRLHPSPHALS